MKNKNIKDGLKNLYAASEDEYQREILNMQQPEEWGTDCQIAAAAHLLQLSILCFSQYSDSGQYHIQQFPPHFPNNQDCNRKCLHETLYLVNNSGSHYDLATVSELQDVEP